MVRPKDRQLKKLLDQFVIVRIVDMNPVDISLIKFDYDLVFAIVFMNADDHIYSRYGNRTAWNAESRFSIAGLKFTMQEVLQAHDREPIDAKQVAKTRSKSEAKPSLFVRELFASKRSCVHCHEVWEGLRRKARKEETFDPRSLFVYPPVESIGLKLHVDFGNRVTQAKANSAAFHAGLRKDDRLLRINDTPIRSQADVTWALHNAPEKGFLKIEYSRSGKQRTATLALKPGWRESKLSWRASMKHETTPKRTRRKTSNSQ